MKTWLITFLQINLTAKTEKSISSKIISANKITCLWNFFRKSALPCHQCSRRHNIYIYSILFVWRFIIFQASIISFTLITQYFSEGCCRTERVIDREDWHSDELTLMESVCWEKIFWSKVKILTLKRTLSLSLSHTHTHTHTLTRHLLFSPTCSYFSKFTRILVREASRDCRFSTVSPGMAPCDRCWWQTKPLSSHGSGSRSGFCGCGGERE